MKISVIIPVYNAEKTIEGTVLSVMKQDYSELEIILVDDGSTDMTGMMCDHLAETDSRIQVFHQDNQGVAAARNRGIEEAHGEAILFLDADDKLLLNALQALRKGLIKGTDACYGKVLRGSERERRGKTKKAQVLQKDELINIALTNPTDLLTIHGWLLRRRIFDNGIQFNTDITIGEDSEMMLQYLNLCKGIMMIPQAVYCYTLQPESTIHKWKPKQKDKYLLMLEMISKTDAAEQRNWPIYVLITLLLILTHDTFHPANPLSRKEKFKQSLQLRNLPIMHEAFQRAELKSVSFEKRIVLTWLKEKRMMLVWIAIKIRQIQNQWRSSNKEK